MLLLVPRFSSTSLSPLARLFYVKCLLISGSGDRKFDTVELLKALTLPPGSRPEIGVAFNPFFPDRAERQRERARLRLKLGTGAVSSVWLQHGSDVFLLAEALDFISTIKRESQLPHLRLYGSVFLPSRKLLAQMKFRPWNGVFLSEGFLSSVEAAEAITRQIGIIYHAHGVELLLESSISKPEEWAAAVRLCVPPPAAVLSVASLVTPPELPVHLPPGCIPPAVSGPFPAGPTSHAASSSSAALRCNAQPKLTKKHRSAKPRASGAVTQTRLP